MQPTTMFMKGDVVYHVYEDQSYWFSHVLNKEQAEQSGLTYDERDLYAMVAPSKEDLFIDGVNTMKLVQLHEVLLDDSDIVITLKNKCIGERILVQLHALDDKQLKAKLQSIVGAQMKKVTSQSERFFSECGSSKRILREFQPVEISFDWYDTLIIDSTGIRLKYEHVGSYQFVDFNQFFTLNP